VKYSREKLKEITIIKTGKLDSNASKPDGIYPFFTCDPKTLRTNTFSFDTEAVLLAGNNASGNFTAKYFMGKFDAYQRTYVIQSADENVLDVRYLGYAIGQKLNQLKTMSSGTTTKFLTIGMLHNLEIPYPETPFQRRIADILSAYDDLIENNQKQIKLLEEAAMRLYKEWFVNLQFPGHEMTKIVDGVPEEWNIKYLIDIADITMGQSPKSEYFNDKQRGLPFHQGVTNYGHRFVADEIYSTSFTRIAEAGSILFSVRAPVGRMNITKNRIVIGRGLAAINHKDEHQSFLFYMLKNRFFKDNLIGNGAIYASITKDDLHSQEFLIPDDKLANKFNSIAKDIDQQIQNADRQIILLQQARDMLLPKLMSGEIEINPTRGETA